MTDLKAIPAQPATPTRTVWPWRDHPSFAWLLLAAIVVAIRPLVPHADWLLVHLVLLGAVTHAAIVWSTHFSQALLKTGPELDIRRTQSRRLAMLFAGVTAVLTGVVAERWWLAVAGATLVSAAVIWHGVMLRRRLRASIAVRFRTSIHYYLAAATCVPVGATLGVLLARGPDDALRGRLLVAHTMVMVLGWLGLTVTGTLVTLWPTILRTRMDTRAESLARQALPVLVSALTVIVAGALAGLRLLTAAGLVLYLAGAAWWGRALWRPLRAKPPAEFAPLAVAAALAWLLIAIGWVAGIIALQGNWADVGASYGRPAAIVAVGFGPQILLGAMSYLVPSVIGGGPAAVRAAGPWVDKWAVWRLVTINGGLAAGLLPTPPAVRALTAGLVVTAYVLALPLMGLAIRASLRARRERPDRLAAPPVRHEPGRRSIWSSGQFVAGCCALALAVCLGVLADPGAAGFPVTSTQSAQSEIAATGRTTTVRVTTRQMRFHPESVDVPAGDRLVIEVVNEDPDTSHDLVLANGAKTARLRPGASQTLDAGVIAGALDGWCSVVGHRQMGMRFAVRVTGTHPGPHTAATSTTAGAVGAPASAAPPIDLHGSPGAGFRATDARLAPATKATVHKVTLTVTEAEAQVAPGIWQRRWTYNGTAPGPTLRGRVGDIFEVTIVNDGSMGHSIDFHAGSLAPDRPMRTIPPGARHHYRFTATHAGIWMYHCSTMPMSAHIAAGMHGAVIIDPPGLAPVDAEYVLVQSEIYLGPDHAQGTAAEVDATKVDAETPDALAFNGIAGQYDHAPLTARVGERVRFWVLDAGPNRSTSFHIVGGQFDTVYAEGAWLLRGAPGQPDAPGGAQVLALAPAQGGFVELTFPEAGHYPFVSHLMVDAERGAHGMVTVTP